MKESPEKKKFYGKTVWANPTTELIRKQECLCLNCGKLNPDQPNNCPVAQALFEICVKENIALIITRCPTWESKF